VLKLVCQSIAFAYDPSGEKVKIEEASLFADAAQDFREGIAAIAEMEDSVLGADDPQRHRAALRHALGFARAPR
jgi:hypothetical protein